MSSLFGGPVTVIEISSIEVETYINKLNALTDVNYYVSGGAALALKENVTFRDVDIYVETDEDYKQIVEDLSKELSQSFVSEHAITFAQYLNDGDFLVHPFQVIKKTKKIEDVISEFDLSICCLYFDRNMKLTISEYFDDSITIKKVHDISTLKRYCKYVSRTLHLNNITSNYEENLSSIEQMIDSIIYKLDKCSEYTNSDGQCQYLKNVYILKEYFLFFENDFLKYYDTIQNYYSDEKLIEIYTHMMEMRIVSVLDYISPEMYMGFKNLFDSRNTLNLFYENKKIQMFKHLAFSKYPEYFI